MASPPTGSPPGLLAFTIFYYVVVYTMWLKRSTPQNIVIGGAAGALPPMVGYAAAAGSLDLSSLLLFLLIFVWTPPHFWSLALVKAKDYGRAGVPMAPNVWGPDATRLQILLYSLLLAPIGALPWILGFAGPVYGAVAVLGGLGMIVGAVAVFRRREGDIARKTAMRNFGFSILYLFALFAVLVAERLVTHLDWGPERCRRRSSYKPLTPEQEKRRRQRNIAIGLAVAALVAIFYAITIVRLGPNVFIRPD